MLDIENKTVFKLNESFSLSSFESKKQKYWLFDLNEGNIYRLNTVSYLILSMLEGKTCFGDIISSVLSQFDDVNKEEIWRDGQEFLTQCLNNGIISIV